MRRSSGWNWRLESLKDQTENLIKRLELIKDSDPFNKRILNDCYDHIKQLQDEVDRLIYHNNNLMNVIYQNQAELENISYELANTEQQL
jgi:methyl-accepting chemotaxis protein